MEHGFRRSSAEGGRAKAGTRLREQRQDEEEELFFAGSAAWRNPRIADSPTARQPLDERLRLVYSRSSSNKPWRTLPLKSRDRKDLFPGALEMMILQMLKQQPLHGYALVQNIKRASNDLLQIERAHSSGPAAHVERRVGQGEVECIVERATGADLRPHRGRGEASASGSIQL